MKRKEPFEWTPEVDTAFQDLKRYLTSPPVMVAPRPLEPLVLYLAATPHSPSATLVTLRKECPVKKPQRDAQPASEVQHTSRKASEVSIDVAADTPPKVTNDPMVIKALERGPHEAKRDLCPCEEQDSTDASSLIEHPVYFVSTVLREARSRYPMP